MQSVTDLLPVTPSIAPELCPRIGVAILLMMAMLMFSVSLVDLAREARIALHDNDLHV